MLKSGKTKIGGLMVTTNMTHASIVRGKLAIVSNSSVIGLGIKAFRAGLAQIENSSLPLKASTIARANVYRNGIALWDAKSE